MAAPTAIPRRAKPTKASSKRPKKESHSKRKNSKWNPNKTEEKKQTIGGDKTPNWRLSKQRTTDRNKLTNNRYHTLRREGSPRTPTMGFWTAEHGVVRQSLRRGFLSDCVAEWIKLKKKARRSSPFGRICSATSASCSKRRAAGHHRNGGSIHKL